MEGIIFHTDFFTNCLSVLIFYEWLHFNYTLRGRGIMSSLLQQHIPAIFRNYPLYLQYVTVIIIMLLWFPYQLSAIKYFCVC